MEVIYPGTEEYPHLLAMLWEKDPIQHPFYLESDSLYSIEYAAKTVFTNLSFLIKKGDVPLLHLYLTVGEDQDGGQHLSYFGRPAYCLDDFSAIEDLRLQKQIEKILKQNIERILKEYNSAQVTCIDFLYDSRPHLFSELLLNNGAVASPSFIRMIDLSLDKKNLHTQLRKSYKSLINWGKKNLSLTIVDHTAPEINSFSDFRELHIQVAGKETRSRKTWEIQEEMIRKGEAFAIFGHLEGKLVTAAFFPYSSTTCYYGVSASKRELFDKPLSHAIVWKAIQHAQKIGCLYFETGEIFFPNQGKGSDKEYSISTFKKGFGGQTLIRLQVCRQS